MALASVLRMIFGQRPGSPPIVAPDAPGMLFFSDEVLMTTSLSDELLPPLSLSDEGIAVTIVSDGLL
jgi:hypothetical protein